MESESIDKESRISSFLEIAVGASGVTAIECLQATSWKLDEAILLFFAVNEADATVPPSYSALAENANSRPDQNLVTGGQDGGYEVCVPPHAKDLFYNDASTTDTSHDILASLYRPPFHVMFNGSFEKAKDAALAQDKWLLVNLQSTKEFSSLMLNRDTWGNEAVSQIISGNFIFWQEYDDTSEGWKVCSFYNMDSIPAVLVIDPITDTIGVSPSDADVTSADKEATSTTQETAYPALPEEPNVDGKRLILHQGYCTCRKVVIMEPSTMGTRRSTGGDLEGFDNAIVWLEPVIVKWLDGLGEEDGLLSLESRGRRPSNRCRECIEPVLGVSSACDSGEA
ncbi:Plant UBX domain-containing protein 7 [Citrus sinensis]|nr:Plant UBX domain-containing protein 7 [Citrus sinensis]